MQGLLGSDGGYDMGIEIGSEGIGKNGDDVRSYSFNLGASRALTLADFSQVDFGVRLTSVGTLGGNRNDSSKIGEETFKVLSPTADTATVDENHQVTGNVFANDHPASSDILTVTGITGGTLGSPMTLTNADGATLTLNSDGSYILDASSADHLSQGEHLTYTFNYGILQHNDTDSANLSSTLTVTVNGVNDAPVAHNDTNHVIESILPSNPDTTTSGNVILGDALGGVKDTDIDRLDTIQVASTSIGTHSLAHGSLLVNADGSYIYTLNNADPAVNGLHDGESLSDTFSYTITDNNGAPASAVLNIIIDGRNDPPIANADTFSITEGDHNPILLSSLLLNDSDPEGDTLTVTNVSGTPSHGTLTLVGGQYQYTLDNTDPAVIALNDGETLTDTLTYSIDDGYGGTASANISITINGVTNEQPPESHIDFPELHQNLSNIVFYLDNDADTTNNFDASGNSTVYKLKFDASPPVSITNIENLHLEDWINSHSDILGGNTHVLAYTIHAGTEFSNTWESSLLGNTNPPVLLHQSEGKFFLVAGDTNGQAVCDPQAIIGLHDHYNSSTHPDSLLFDMGITGASVSSGNHSYNPGGVLGASPDSTHTIQYDSQNHIIIV